MKKIDFLKRLLLRIFFILPFITGINIVNAQYTALYNFNGTTGNDPWGSLTLSGSTLYGMTSKGGAHNKGLVFSMNKNGTNYRDLHDFDSINGQYPIGNLTLVKNKLCGMTQDGGKYNFGVAFSIDTTGSSFKTLLTFNDTNGANPCGSFILSGTQLFGMTRFGGNNGLGIVFSIDTNGLDYKNLLAFNGSNGNEPFSSLTLSGTTLYGMTTSGGAKKSGTIFSIDTNGSNFNLLYSFPTLSGIPYGALILSGSHLYGMSVSGGAYGLGSIFSIDTDGLGFKNLYSYGNIPGIGYEPYGSLVLFRKTLYGMTKLGGKYGFGTIFSMDTNGIAYKQLLSFDSSTDGYRPLGSLAFSPNTFYGMTYGGGKNGDGLVFSYALLNMSPVNIPLSCNGSDNGEAIANAIGVAPPYTYSWMPGGSTRDTVTGLSAGTYTVTVTDSTHLSGTATVVVTQPAALNFTATYIPQTTIPCNGKAMLLLTGGTSPYIYKWSGGETTDSINGQCAGTYCCLITDAHGCHDTACVSIDNEAGVDQVQAENEKVKVYPNPSTGQFIVTLTNAELVSASQPIIQIYNMLGERVYSETLKQVQGNNIIDMIDQPNGVYLYRVMDKEGNLTGQGKLIIQK